MITSASNAKLKLVRRLLESRRQREKEGLFVCEGEDIVAAADAAGIEPVELLRAGVRGTRLGLCPEPPRSTVARLAKRT